MLYSITYILHIMMVGGILREKIGWEGSYFIVQMFETLKNKENYN